MKSIGSAPKAMRFLAGNVVRVLVVSLGLLLCSVPAFPQLNLGRIYGAVTDQSRRYRAWRYGNRHRRSPRSVEDTYHR